LNWDTFGSAYGDDLLVAHDHGGALDERPPEAPVAMQHIRNRDVIAQQVAGTVGKSIEPADIDKHHVEPLAVPRGGHLPGPVSEAVVGIERRAVG
jgi:hypothetical protein